MWEGGGVWDYRKDGASDRYSPAVKYIYWSILKKSRHLGFGVLIDIRSMVLHFLVIAIYFILSKT